MAPSKKTALFKSLLVTVLGLFLIFPRVTMSEEGRIIKIEGTGGATCTGIGATPAELTIEKDVIVIWLNAIKGEEVNILFDDGKTIKNATDNPMGFDLDKKGIYAAKYLPFISTTSLRFIKKGTYHYRVISQNNKFTTQGTIIVP
jgi:hypothetical protein